MKEWLLENALGSQEEIEKIETEAKKLIKDSRLNALKAYQQPILEQAQTAKGLLKEIIDTGEDKTKEIEKALSELSRSREPLRRDVMKPWPLGGNFVRIRR